VTATYDPSLGDNVSWVRFLIRDTDTSSPLLQDEEIAAVLTHKLDTITSPAAWYFAAADLLSTLHRQWMTRGKGVASKKISKLSVTYGTGVGINVDAAMQEAIKDLRRQGAHLLCPSPKSFAIL
jgi:hypothetical protein